MIEIKDKKDCCGCTACYSICPKNCITMQEDNEGFKYPVIEKANCIDCGLCEKACPIINNKKLENLNQKVYIVNNKSDDIRKESSSGGAFTAIAEYAIENNGIVFGASFDENFDVHHKYVATKEDLKAFRCSKYVQSNLKETFREVKQFLNDGKVVCYSGTPCQIEGLKCYLNKDYDNLITIDVVCRAIPSPLYFRKYKEYIKKKLNSKEIKKLVFRDKEDFGYRYSTMKITTENNVYSAGIETDPHFRAFFSALSVRPSCTACHFKKQNRVGDFTIWDCHRTEEWDKSMDDKKGTTRVLIHSVKGHEIFDKIKDKIIYCEVPMEEAVHTAKEIYASVNENPNREKMYQELNSMEPEEFFKKNFPDSIKIKYNRFLRKMAIKNNIFWSLKNILKHILKKSS